LGLAHMKFLINIKDTFMHWWKKLFSPTLLPELQ
jgi:hypothetical protein